MGNLLDAIERDAERYRALRERAESVHSEPRSTGNDGFTVVKFSVAARPHEFRDIDRLADALVEGRW